MIQERLLPELKIFRRIERDLPLETNLDFGKRVVQNGNDSLPVHRWFKFKESFSADLLCEVLGFLLPELGKEIRLLDPFCGAGTSLLASQEMSSSGFHIEAIGIERNPFIAFVAKAKLQWPCIDALKLASLGEKVLKESKCLAPPIPPLSSLTTGRCISRYLSERLMAVSAEIRRDGDSSTHDALHLGVASAIEAVSHIRKDGRALRIVNRTHPHLATVLRKRWETIAADTNLLQKTLSPVKIPRVVLGDGRKLSNIGIAAGSIDLVLTSPPYPNNIDYSEVYKLELWLLSFIKDRESFLNLRKSTFRSHPISSEPEQLLEFMAEIRKNNGINNLLRPILLKIDGTSEQWRRRVLLGYFCDMWEALKEQYRCLRRSGYAVFVVGNSLHGGAEFPYLIPTDMVVSAIGEMVGFRLQQIIVSRAFKRRIASNHFLRESLVVLKKP